MKTVEVNRNVDNKVETIYSIHILKKEFYGCEMSERSAL